jgi:hypothetical protein
MPKQLGWVLAVFWWVLFRNNPEKQRFVARRHSAFRETKINFGIIADIQTVLHACDGGVITND